MWPSIKRSYENIWRKSRFGREEACPVHSTRNGTKKTSNSGDYSVHESSRANWRMRSGPWLIARMTSGGLVLRIARYSLVESRESFLNFLAVLSGL